MVFLYSSSSWQIICLVWNLTNSYKFLVLTRVLLCLFFQFWGIFQFWGMIMYQSCFVMVSFKFYFAEVMIAFLFLFFNLMSWSEVIRNQQTKIHRFQLVSTVGCPFRTILKIDCRVRLMVASRRARTITRDRADCS